MDLRALSHEEREQRLQHKRELGKANRAYLKSRGRCIHCGHADDLTRAGGATCGLCRLKQREATLRYQAKHPQKTREYHIQYQRARMEAGRCQRCGKPIDSDSRWECSSCAAKRNILQNERYKQRTRRDGAAGRTAGEPGPELDQGSEGPVAGAS